MASGKVSRVVEVASVAPIPGGVLLSDREGATPGTKSNEESDADSADCEKQVEIHGLYELYKYINRSRAVC